MATIPVVNTHDRRKGIITAIFTLLLLLFYFMWATLEKADPPPQPPIVLAETIMPEEIDLRDFVIDGGAASGTPTDDVVKPPTPQTQQVLTNNNSNTSTPTGQSNHTNANNSNNTSSTSQQSTNPFGSGGSNGGDGPGGAFQGSDGPGVNGPGSGIERKRQNDLVLDHLDFSERAIVSLTLTIDAQGNVVAATCNKSKTTTTNQIIINKVISEVKRQLKYNKDPGSPLTKVTLDVRIDPK